MSDAPEAVRKPGSRASNRRSFRQRHPAIVWSVVLIVLLPLVGGAAYAWNLKRKLDDVETVKLNPKSAPDPDEGRALNVLLLGSDKGEPKKGQPKNTTIAEDAASGDWPVGKYRSDTLMIVHIPADRKKVYLVSLPRDSFVPIYDAEGKTTHSEKLNAAFSMGGPVATINTVEKLTGLKMDHLAIIDWAGFKDLSSAVGGVEVTIPRSFYDPQQKIQWNAGKQTLEGKKALDYVRTRYGLAGGDFDRIKRQQNFMRALMGKMLSSGVTTNPNKLTKTVSALTDNLTVDEGWSGTAMAKLALSLRGITTDDVTFMTAPVQGTQTDPTYGSVVILQPDKLAELFTALGDDRMGRYLKKYPDDVLPDAEDVS
ncbi:LCP family protein [Aeromicrobium duanguangcaii]|uniref:LCP family protein n=1 Tax=Aeromicrobium duanguangcaii TaxID=2968086 RepID=UPI002017B7B6|nr:LCP family protein [Aeromicrobium duanguangcaii]